MVPSDVSNRSGSGRERVTFESVKLGLGVWKMAWTDTVSGHSMDGNRYAYRQRFEYLGLTTDGKAPKPNHGTPTSENSGFLQIVPSNVNADALDLSDFFLLQAPDGNVVAKFPHPLDPSPANPAGGIRSTASLFPRRSIWGIHCEPSRPVSRSTRM